MYYSEGIWSDSDDGHPSPIFPARENNALKNSGNAWIIQACIVAAIRQKENAKPKYKRLYETDQNLYLEDAATTFFNSRWKVLYNLKKNVLVKRPETRIKHSGIVVVLVVCGHDNS